MITFLVAIDKKKKVVYLMLSENVRKYGLWMWRLYTDVPVSYVLWFCDRSSEYEYECDG